MIRRPLNVAAVMSLLLMAAAVAASVRIDRWPLGGLPSTAPVQVMLARPLPAIQFREAALGDVIDFLRDVSGVRMDVDWPALATSGVRPDTLVTCGVNNRPYGEVIATVLSAPGDAEYRVGQDGIRVSTAAALRADTGQSPASGEAIIRGRRWSIGGDGAVLRIVISPQDPTAVSRLPPAAAQAARGELDREPLHFLGAAVRYRGYPYHWWTAAVPFWILALVTSIAPGLWLRARVRRMGRRRRGQCLRCGYDLRATPERCPECGEALLSQ